MKKTPKPMEHKDALEMLCPFQQGFLPCEGRNCMAWVVINPRIERENHSGGMDMMSTERAKRNFQEIKKEGYGCDAVLILEEQGICSRLLNKEE